MAIPPVALKRKNHRLLLCESARKHDLLLQLIETHGDKRIAVAVSGNDVLTLPESVTLLSDTALPKEEEASFDLVINYDLPADPQRYLDRLALCDDIALTLLDEADKGRLMAIETLLGRSILQERPEGFAPAITPRPKQQPKRNQRPAVPLYDDEAPKKPHFKKEARPEQKRKPKESGVSRYIGSDENGKPMFSGKTGERNHRKDGKPHDEESLAAKKEWEDRRKKSGGAKPYNDRGGRPPFKEGERGDRPKKFEQGDGRPRKFDNKPRREEEGDRRPREERGERHENRDKPSYGEKKPYRGDRKPYDGKTSFKGDGERRKPFEKSGERRDGEGGERKPFDKKKPPFKGERKDHGGKPPFKGNKKPYDAKPKTEGSGEQKPKRPPRRIKADKFKPTEPKE